MLSISLRYIDFRAFLEIDNIKNYSDSYCFKKNK